MNFKLTRIGGTESDIVIPQERLDEMNSQSKIEEIRQSVLEKSNEQQTPTQLKHDVKKLTKMDEESQWKKKLRQDPYLYLQAPEEIKNNSNIVLELLKITPEFFQLLTPEMQSNPEFLAQAFQYDTLSYWPEEIILKYKGDKKFIMDCASEESNIKDLRRLTMRLYTPEIGEDMDFQKELALKIIKPTLPDEILDSEQDLLINLNNKNFNRFALQPKFISDIEFIKKVLEKAPHLKDELPEEIKIKLSSTNQDKSETNNVDELTDSDSIENQPLNLNKNAEHMLSRLEYDKTSWIDVHQDLWNDPEFCTKYIVCAIQKHGMTLEEIGMLESQLKKNFLNNAEIVVAALEKDPKQDLYFSNDLLRNYKFLQKAALKNPSILVSALNNYSYIEIYRIVKQMSKENQLSFLNQLKEVHESMYYEMWIDLFE